MIVIVLWPLLTVPWVGLQYMIVVFPDQIHLLYWRAGLGDTLVKTDDEEPDRINCRTERQIYAFL